MIAALRKWVRRFSRDEDGGAAVEAMLVLPILLWAFVASFVMFDAYKKQTDGLKVSYAVADALSREENDINQTFLNSMLKLSDFMTFSPEKLTQRVSIVCYSPQNQSYTVAWSRSTGPKKSSYPAHTNTSIHNERGRLPVIPLGDQLIVVETFMRFTPIVDIGLSDQIFEYWTFTRPRFTNQVKWQGQNSWVCPSA
ncbi:MAG: hypothetical protein AAF092_04955 [Pseudomonadota bacterium]